jgi:hypothetical protein
MFMDTLLDGTAKQHNKAGLQHKLTALLFNATDYSMGVLCRSPDVHGNAS